MRRVPFLAGVGILGSSLAPYLAAAPLPWPTAEAGNGHSYEYVAVPYDPERPLTWDDAKTESEARGGYLSTITSQAESDWVWQNLGGVSLSHSWLGGYQLSGSTEPAGGWAWVTGEPWLYTNWAEGEPNNWDGNDPAGEGFLMLGRWSESDNRWNDVDGSTRNYPADYASGFIVEYAAVPEPGVISICAVSGLTLLGRRNRRRPVGR